MDWTHGESVEPPDSPGGEEDARRELLARAGRRRRLGQRRTGLALVAVHDGPGREGGRLVLRSRYEPSGGPAPPERGDDGFVDAGGYWRYYRDVTRAGEGG